MPEESALRERVEKILEELRPQLQEEGEDVELVTALDSVVAIRLKGACKSCPSAEVTLYQMISEMLRAQIPEIEEVRSV